MDNFGEGDLHSTKHAQDQHQNLTAQLVLLKELEKVKSERDDLQKSKEQLQRDIMNQTFESNLEMKEEIQMLRE